MAEGERLVNRELARFLERLASAPPREAEAGFAAADLAPRIAADMADGGGLLTAADLSAYRVCERAPLAVAYRGHQVLIVDVY